MGLTPASISSETGGDKLAKKIDQLLAVEKEEKAMKFEILTLFTLPVMLLGLTACGGKTMPATIATATEQKQTTEATEGALEPSLRWSEPVETVIADLKRYIPDRMREGDIPGLAIALIRDGEVYSHRPGPDRYVAKVRPNGRVYRHKAGAPDDYLGEVEGMQSLAEGGAAFFLLLLPAVEEAESEAAEG